MVKRRDASRSGFTPLEKTTDRKPLGSLAGFTLGELLVVIAIFFLMVAILTPFVELAKRRANNITCADNLMTISLGLHLYASGHDGVFPKDLAGLYPNYVKDEKVFDCPATKSTGTPDRSNYIYVAGLNEASPLSEVIVYDEDGNHKSRGRNILRINGSVEWVRSLAGKPR